MNEVVQVLHLSKQFTDIKAVDDLTFSVSKGEVYGFLGQNGAGKSTTIRMLLTLIKASSGSIRLFGKDLHSHRHEILKQVGAIIEKPDLYKYLTALENLRMMAQLSGFHPTRKQLIIQLAKVGIAERADSKVNTYSQGMKQRLGIACALVHDPQLIILDEPTNGLDPLGIADVRNLILHLSREEGKTVFVSSHLLSEIELIADSMLIIDKGRKIVEGKVSDLLDPADTLVEIETLNDLQTMQLIQQSQWQRFVQSYGTITLKMHREEIPELTKFLIENNVALLSIRSVHSLENYFLSLTTANRHVAAYKN
ncbi:MAG: ABC transporter ATP-binding protein [Flavisolibacter sp.]